MKRSQAIMLATQLTQTVQDTNDVEKFGLDLEHKSPKVHCASVPYNFEYNKICATVSQFLSEDTQESMQDYMDETLLHDNVVYCFDCEKANLKNYMTDCKEEARELFLACLAHLEIQLEDSRSKFGEELLRVSVIPK